MILPPGKIKKFQEGGSAQPYVASAARSQSMMDPVLQQLMFGLDGQGGFLPGAFRAAERTFFDEQGRPIVIPQEIAGFSPDQIAAQQLAREQIGIQQPFLQRAAEEYQRGLGSMDEAQRQQLFQQRRALGDITGAAGEETMLRRAGLRDALQGIGQGRREAIQAERGLGRDLRGVEQIGRQAASEFGRDLSGIEHQQAATQARFGQELSRSLGTGQRAAGEFGRDLSGIESLARRATGRFEQGVGQGTGEMRRGAAEARRGLAQQHRG